MEETSFPAETLHWPPLGSVYKTIINWSTIITIRVLLEKRNFSYFFTRCGDREYIIEYSTKCLLFFHVVLSNNYLTSPVKL